MEENYHVGEESWEQLNKSVEWVVWWRATGLYVWAHGGSRR